MDFSFSPFLDVDTYFFRQSVLAVVLFLQIILGMVLPGQGHTQPHTVWFSQKLLASLSHKLNRAGRSKGALKTRGLLAFLFVLLVAWGLARLSIIAAYQIPYGWLVSVLIVWGAVNILVPWRALRVLINAPDLKSLPRLNAGLKDLTDLEFSKTDPHTTARGAIEYAGFTSLKFLVAPVFFYLFFGIYGLMFYVFITFPPHGIEFGHQRSQVFFRLFQAGQNVFDFVPARITAFVMYLAAILTPTAHPGLLFNTVFDGAQKWPGIAYGSVVKAIAGAVNVSLGGGLIYRDSDKIIYPWVGPKEASAKAVLADIKRAFVLMVFMTVLIFLALLITIVL